MADDNTKPAADRKETQQSGATELKDDALEQASAGAGDINGDRATTSSSPTTKQDVQGPHISPAGSYSRTG